MDDLGVAAGDDESEKRELGSLAQEPVAVNVGF